MRVSDEPFPYTDDTQAMKALLEGHIPGVLSGDVYENRVSLKLRHRRVRERVKNWLRKHVAVDAMLVKKGRGRRLVWVDMIEGEPVRLGLTDNDHVVVIPIEEGQQ